MDIGPRRRRRGLLGAGALASVAVLAVATGSAASTADAQPLHPLPAQWLPTTTPIKHVVVLFDENISFDHYFGTYPNAANTDGTRFTAAHGTPKVDGLDAQAADRTTRTRTTPSGSRPSRR